MPAFAPLELVPRQMDLEKLISEEGTNDPSNKDFALDKEIACRLEKLVGEWLSRVECVALMGILKHHSFICEDGFIINGFIDVHDEDPRNAYLSYRPASFIAAAFCQSPDVDADIVWNEYMWHGDDEPYLEAKASLMERIQSHPSIRRITLDEWLATQA